MVSSASLVNGTYNHIASTPNSTSSNPPSEYITNYSPISAN